MNTQRSFWAPSREQEAASGDPLIGSTAGSFKVLEKLGAGGMGVVYKGLDLKLRREVALKFLPEAVARDAAALERFRREARAASALNHPNICTIYDICEHEGKLFIVMEMMEGMSLRQKLANGPLGVSEVLTLGSDIASGLAAAHSKGIIHRDIKPANIFVTADGRAKVLDFGLAKVLPAQMKAVAADSTIQTSLTAPGATVGTIAYMSPEQARGEELDTRCDLFSFGATLYEIATGVPAFQGKSLAEIYDAILNRQPTAASQVNPEIPPHLQEVIAKALNKNPALRYQSAADMGADLERISRDPAYNTDTDIQQWRLTYRTALSIMACLLTLVTVAAIIYYFHAPRRAFALTNKDTVVLADFTNNTGEPIFDDALRQGLAVQLTQSPYLNILSDQRVRATLGLMKQPVSTRLSHEIAAEVCQRTNSTAMIGGSISRFGGRYQLILEAQACAKADEIARVQTEAQDRDHVLAALGSIATQIRTRLGELPASIKKYDVPIYEATTNSLEALKMFSLGARAAETDEGDARATALFKQATVLDPNFALAYYRLSAHYGNVGEEKLSAEAITKAYALRDRVSTLDNYRISWAYFGVVEGNLNEAIQRLNLWAERYPSDGAPHFLAGNLYMALGQHAKALEEERKAVELNPQSEAANFTMGTAYFALNRMEEAKAALERAVEQGATDAHSLALYALAFYQNDKDGMAAQLAWGKQKVGLEDLFLQVEAETTAYSGRLQQANELWRSAQQAASRNGSADRARWSEFDAALAEAEYGFSDGALTAGHHALKDAGGPLSKVIGALILARAGDIHQSAQLAVALARQKPSDTLLNYYWLPAVRASIALRRGKGQQAIDLLAPALPYEMGLQSYSYASLYPIYLRGQGYMLTKNGAMAAAEFHKLIEHRNLGLQSPCEALAHLWLGRALASKPENRMQAQQASSNFRHALPTRSFSRSGKMPILKFRF